LSNIVTKHQRKCMWAAQNTSVGLVFRPPDVDLNEDYMPYTSVLYDEPFLRKLKFCYSFR
jgi:hypothetical protein